MGKDLKKKPEGMLEYKKVFNEGNRVKAEDFGLFTHSNNRTLFRLGDYVARQGSWSFSMYKVENEKLVEIHNSFEYEQ